MTTSSLLLLLLSVAAVNLLGAASPGPAFFIVSRTAVGQSRKAGLATAAGVSIATVIWAFGAIHGLVMCYVFAPVFFVLVGGAVMFGYKLDAKRQGEIRTALVPGRMIGVGKRANGIDQHWLAVGGK